MDELKPCPFCGYNMATEEVGAYQKAGFVGPQTPVWEVCCGSTGCNASVSTTSRESAVTAWNTRAASGALNEPFGNAEQLASLEQRARDALSGMIRSMADIVNVTQTDAQFDADVLPRNPVMDAVAKLRQHWDELSKFITAALANQQEGDINPSGPSFQAGYDTGHSEFQWLAGLVNNPVCERCGATSDADAEKKCRPTDCSCPGTEFPLAQLWALQQPQANQQGVGGWQSIETAPKGGRQMILLLTPSRWPQVAFSNTWWISGFSVECKPTHWMHVPEFPTQPAGDVGRGNG